MRQVFHNRFVGHSVFGAQRIESEGLTGDGYQLVFDLKAFDFVFGTGVNGDQVVEFVIGQDQQSPAQTEGVEGESLIRSDVQFFVLAHN